MICKELLTIIQTSLVLEMSVTQTSGALTSFEQQDSLQLLLRDSPQEIASSKIKEKKGQGLRPPGLRHCTNGTVACQDVHLIYEKRVSLYTNRF